jgi:cyclophilin family peptidyl-prolyl cis-trans isomerase
MYTGAYSYSEENGLTYKPYYETIKNFENYADFPVSVWMNNNKSNPTYTVYGEFSDNHFSVKNGNLKETFGALTMYYFDKDTTAKVYTPYLKEEKAGELASRAYKYNSATSMFFITLSEGETSNTKYCTFANLEEDSVEELKEFKADLDEWIATFDSADDFITETEMLVDQDDAFVGDKKTKKTFRTPNKPIVIKKVTVKKY